MTRQPGRKAHYKGYTGGTCCQAPNPELHRLGLSGSGSLAGALRSRPLVNPAARHPLSSPPFLSRRSLPQPRSAPTSSREKESGRVFPLLPYSSLPEFGGEGGEESAEEPVGKRRALTAFRSPKATLRAGGNGCGLAPAVDTTARLGRGELRRSRRQRRVRQMLRGEETDGAPSGSRERVSVPGAGAR